MSDPQTRQPWAVVSTPELQQGDIISDCPLVIVPAFASSGPLQPGTLLSVEAQVEFREAVVLTQSCDLTIRPEVAADRHKLEAKLQTQVLLAVVHQ